VTHMVIFRRADGTPGQHQAENLEQAMRFVESLRNRENVTDSRIFFMQEVPIEFKTVYKVEVIGAAPVTGSLVEAPAEPAPMEEQPVAEGTEEEADLASSPARFGIFSRS
jgi:hypothetical protein